jgi:cytochrome P450
MTQQNATFSQPNTKTLKTPPTPPGHFLFGNIPELRLNGLDVMSRYWREYGDVVRMNLALRHMTMISHPELARDVMVDGRAVFTKIHRADGKPTGLQLALGEGLLTNANHDSWLSQRRMMQPMFHRKSIDAMGAKMIAGGNRLLNRWDKTFQSGDVIEANHEMMRVTLDIINQTMFSADVVEEAENVGPAVTTMARFAFNYERSPIKPPMWAPLPRVRRFKSARSRIDEIIYGLIRSRRESGEMHGDLLDMLLAARDEDTGEGMTDQQLRDEVITIFGAGHETTSNALTWTWYALSQHPDILKRLQNELDTILQGKTPKVDDLTNLPYTKAVLEESLRVFPPAPLIPRQVMEDAVIGGYKIEAGSRALINVYNIHRHPDFWEDAETFTPERFLPEARNQIDRNAYIPFGAGARLCIGNNFALMEGQLLLAMIAQRYELKLVEDHPVVKEVAITLRPHHGMKMQLFARH